MEWNFLFRVDYLNEKGEERNLKGLIFTDEGKAPTAEQIQEFLMESGYQVNIQDPQQLTFIDPNPSDPIKITVVKLHDEDDQVNDWAMRLLAEQFRKQY
ncbi:hypothetical protein [Ammoniphilus sp. YIM 78166]|uniref:hypothetical protein n=1 Tax=Ammoniphilus sp. YIM 78166 TaxID=1644106 RepID=UPI00106F1CDF|nr:hypothetical protein [Ammoniphilus sp. YIM 78166]